MPDHPANTQSPPPPKVCYWCGAPATSKEHVPPDNLFPANKKINLITVPACKAHNEDFNELDEEFRVYMQARETSPDALAQFQDKTFRGLSRPEGRNKAARLAKGARQIDLGGQKRLVLRVDPVRQYQYFEKIIRGIYFHLYRHPAPGQVFSYSRDFIVPSLDYAELAKKLGPLLNSPEVQMGKVSNPDIFKYKYVRAIEPGGEVFLVAMVFYGGVEVQGWMTTAPLTPTLP
jgi:hypothetical protein